MCLMVEGEKFMSLIAEEEKTYYKVLLYQETDFMGNDKYVTPYYNFSVLLGTNYSIPERSEWKVYQTAHPVSYDGPGYDGPYYSYRYFVEGNCFHFFQRREDAERCARRMDGGIVVKAIVPKGTEYVEGYTINADGPVMAAAAKKVKYEKI